MKETELLNVTDLLKSATIDSGQGWAGQTGSYLCNSTRNKQVNVPSGRCEKIDFCLLQDLRS
jgi:hypothetical protein